MHKTKVLFLAVGVLCVGLYLALKGRPAAPQSAQQDQLERPLSFATEPVPAKIQPKAPLGESAVPHTVKTLIERIASGDTNAYRLSSEQIQAFLTRNRTNGEALLAAFNVSGNADFLREAERRYPNDPRVLAAVLGSDALSEKRGELVNRLKQVSGDNPLGNYFAAREAFRNQQPEEAYIQMQEASTKTTFTDFTMERAQGLEELYLSAGHSVAEAKALATMGVNEPSLPLLRDVAAGLSALERQYVAGGDVASAELVAKQGLALSANIANAGTRSLATGLLAGSVERSFLSPLNPAGSYDFLGQPVEERLSQLRQDRQEVLSGMEFYDEWLRTASETQLIPYFDRVRLYGEAAALNWARAQTGDSQPR
jgi:hypothetical protein